MFITDFRSTFLFMFHYKDTTGCTSNDNAFEKLQKAPYKFDYPFSYCDTAQKVSNSKRVLVAPQP
ncbi:hypothetical protein CW304_12195 [Bacillus sp. UFRGS-B20]|nr:hypothetical protein CW304_12195 [Bacillus sp. UFRGS-B20]